MDAAPLTGTEQQSLLSLARQVVTAVVNGLPPPDLPVDQQTDGLLACHAAFVTIMEQGELRGCIGRMDYNQATWKNVQYAAAAAALDDPRFTPLDPSELPLIHLEISILEPPVPLSDPAFFNPQTQGIIIEKGVRHALLLPKVAQEYGWTARQTLEAVCKKAGLRSDAWRDPDAHLQVFTAFDFREP
jgi:AmmeMemoRadiSam system protein A